MNSEELYKELLGKYGDKQVYVAIEELSELQKELCKYLRGKGDIRNMIEEIADVTIMIKQMMVYFGIEPSTVEFVMTKKLERTKERLLK